MGNAYSEIGLVAKIEGVGQYSRGLNTIVRSTTAASSSMRRSFSGINANIFSSVGNSVTNLGNQIRSLGGQLSGVGFAVSFGFTIPVVAAFTKAISVGREWEKGLIKLQYLGGANASTIDFWSRKLRDLSGELGKMPLELLEGLYYIMSVGARNTAQAQQILTVSAKASTVGLGEQYEVSKALTAILHVFGSESITAAKAGDMLFAAVREAGAEVETFSTNLGRALAATKAAGVSLDDLLGYVAIYTRSGVSASVATTSFTNALQVLIDPTKEAIATLERYGLSVQQLKDIASDPEQGFAQMLELLNAKMGTDIAKLFSQRGTVGIFDVVNAKDYAEVVDKIRDSVGDIDAAFKAYTKTADFAFKQAAAKLQSTAITLFDALKRPLAELLGRFNEFLTRLESGIADNPQFTALAIRISLIAAALGPAIILLGQFVRSLGVLTVFAGTPLKVLGGLLGFLIGPLVGGFKLAGSAVLFFSIPLFKFLKGFFGITAKAFKAVGPLFFSLAKGFLGVKKLFFDLGEIIAKGVTRIGVSVLRLPRMVISASYSISGALLALSGKFIGFSAVIARVLRSMGFAFYLFAMKYTSVLSGALTRFAFVGVAALGRIGTAFTFLATNIVAKATVSIVGSIASMTTALAGIAVSALGGLLALGAPFLAVIGVITALGIAVVGIKKKVSSAFDKISSEARTKSGDLKKDMAGYGKNIVEEFGKGMIFGLIAVVRALRTLMQTIRNWLKPGSPPKLLPDIDDWGTGAMEAYLEGWTQVDFSAFKSIADQFRSFFESLLPVDDEGNKSGRIALIQNLLQFREVLASAINEINSSGNLTEMTWARVAAALSGATEEMRNFARLTLEAAAAQERVNDLTDQIKGINAKYDDALRPIDKELGGIQEQQTQFSEKQRMEELRKILENPNANAQVRRMAQLELRQIRLQQARRGIEAQREEELDPVEEQLRIAQLELDSINRQLEYATQLVQLQVEQNNLLRELLEAQKPDDAGAADAGPKGEDLGPLVEPLETEDIGFETPDFGEGVPKIDRRDKRDRNLGPASLDAQIKRLLNELTLLQEETGSLFSTIGGRISEAWNTKIKPAYDAWSNHPLTQSVRNAFSTISESFGTAYDNFIKIIGPFEETETRMQSFMDQMAPLGPVIESVAEGIGSLIGSIGTLFGDIVDSALQAISGIKNFVVGVFELVAAIGAWITGVEGADVKIREALRRIFTGILQWLAAIVRIVLTTILTVIGGFIDVFLGIVIRAMTALQDLTGFDFGPGIAKLDEWRANSKEKFDGYREDVRGALDNVTLDSAMASTNIAGNLGKTGKAATDAATETGTATGSMSSFYAGLHGGASTSFLGISTLLGTYGTDLGTGETQTGTFQTLVSGAFGETETSLVGNLTNIATKVSEWITKLDEAITKAQTTKDEVTTRFTEIGTHIQEKVDAIREKIQDMIDKLLDLKDKADEYIGNITDFFRDAKDDIVGWIGDIIGKIQEWWDRLVNFWNWLTGKDFSPGTGGGGGGPEESTSAATTPTGTPRIGPPRTNSTAITGTQPLNVRRPARLNAATVGSVNTVSFGDTYVENGVDAIRLQLRIRQIIEDMLGK